MKDNLISLYQPLLRAEGSEATEQIDLRETARLIVPATTNSKVFCEYSEPQLALLQSPPLTRPIATPIISQPGT